MIIETAQTADTNTINFYTPTPLLPNESIEFIDQKSIRKSPLAEKLFDISGINLITIHHNLISVTKQNQSSWDDLKPQILAEIMEFLATGQELIRNTDNNFEIDVVKRIKSLLEARIRPAIRQDNGDIVFRNFENGIVYVELLGNCIGCPYALNTLKEGVEKILKTYIPEVKSVEHYQES